MRRASAPTNSAVASAAGELELDLFGRIQTLWADPRLVH